MNNKITRVEIRKTAELARIKLTKKEEEKFTEDLDKILNSFADIQEAQLSGVEKFDHYYLNKNQLRSDQVLEKEEGLVKGIKENFPEEKDDYLKVKTVIKK